MRRPSLFIIIVVVIEEKGDLWTCIRHRPIYEKRPSKKHKQFNKERVATDEKDEKLITYLTLALMWRINQENWESVEGSISDMGLVNQKNKKKQK